MAGVFISYRRDDSPGHAGRVFDSLRTRLGADMVFMDVYAIDAGVDFVDALERAVGSCDALLAVIGPGWLSASEHGRRRLDEPLDFVRLEIRAALKRNVRVVPVLVDHADLPPQAELPDDLKALTARNAVELRDSRWDADVSELVESMERLTTASRGDGVGLAQRTPSSRLIGRRSRVVWGAAATIVLVSAGATFSSRACAPERDEAVRAVANARPTLIPPSREATSDKGNTAIAPAAADPSVSEIRILAFGLGLVSVTDTPPGVIVGRVQPGGPAAIAGILPGDVLVSVAGRFPDGFSSVADAVVAHVKTTPAGTPGVVDIVRQGKPHTLFVVFDRAFVSPP